ncbi:MAG: DUF4124 domain-containing protein [Proteobacteria bacterium]|uniref:DUF4124 domain-containing protein n=1 Tax=Rudaea sp. TaxID=2136325 RepID=UPI001D4C3049|nr:DUF4124 domain-containing protein [Pseudomonadota bacterium]MBS0566937.1 DUF4124 domain-containing protein [Pseudomonadota bacterium]
MSRVRVVSIRRASASFALAALLAGGFASATELYKWTDKNGVVHYSDTAPQDADSAQRVRLAGTEAPVADPAEKKPESAPADAAKPVEPAPTALPDTPENRKRLCEQSRAALDLLQSKFQVADSTGKPLDAKTRADRTAAASQSVASYCQNPG